MHSLAQLLTAAEEQIERLEAEPDAPDRTARLLQASLLTQLAAALLLEPDFPAGPQGLEQRQDRERARRAVRFLWARHEHRTRRLVTRAPELAPAPKRVPPRTEADRQLAAETAATVRELRELQLDLFGDDLELTRRYESGSRSSAVQEAAWGLLVGYWPSQRRWLRSKREPPTKQSALVSRRSAELHRPTWQHEVSREFWHRLNPDVLFWSDPLPCPDSTPPSQEL